jgi:hypothetical protein
MSVVLEMKLKIKKKIKALFLKLSPNCYLNYRENKIYKKYDEKLKKAETNNNQDRVNELNAWLKYEMDTLIEERETICTKKLMNKATKLKVKIPKKYNASNNLTDDWEQGPFGSCFLSKKGIKKLRQEIREEEKWRIEKRTHKIKWITALTGIIGALTGLFAVIFN